MTENTEKQPLFSLITITLNNVEGLQKTYKSVSNQLLNNYEWVVIDGKSSDETPEWLKTAPAHWVSEPDSGIYDAMNKGIERASGKYLLFLNAGDMLAEPQTLKKIAQAIEKNSPDFIYGDAYEDGLYKRARHHSKIARGMITHHQSMLYRTRALEDMRYNLNYKIAADYDLTARFLQKTDKAFYSKFPICIFETGGVSQINAAEARTEEAQIRKTLGIGSPLGNVLTTLRQALAQTIKTKTPWLYRIIR